MASTRFGSEKVAIENLAVSAYTVPTDFPESDGTITWDKTTIVIVEAAAGDKRSLGYTYADVATATLINELLKDIVVGKDAMNVPGIWKEMVHAIRNLGRPGIASMAISAVDNALWDLKARLLELPLVTLLGAVRDGAPVYGSGGFTSYSREQLQRQLGDWVADGIPRVKMKIGRNPADDPARVADARAAIGTATELFVDANGAYSRTEAMAMAAIFASESGVTWFEEPVSSDDLEGLNVVRNRAPLGMDIAAGEYGYDFVVLPSHVGSQRGRCTPGRCNPLRRHYRFHACRRTGRGPFNRTLGSLRPIYACSPVLCTQLIPTPGILP